jgi:hypothetical protein
MILSTGKENYEYKIDRSTDTIITYDKTPFLKTFTASSPALANNFIGALTEFSFTISTSNI